MKKNLLLLSLLFVLTGCEFIYEPSSNPSIEDSFSSSENSSLISESESSSQTSSDLSIESNKPSEESSESIVEKIDLSQVLVDMTEGLDFNNITTDISLKSSIEGVEITCTSDRPDVLSNDGKLYFIEEDCIVRYTVTLSYQNDSYSKTLLLTIKGTKLEYTPINSLLNNNDTTTYYKINGIITGKLKNNVYYLRDQSGAILVNIPANENITIGDEISLIGNVFIESNNYIVSNTNNIKIISNNNLDEVNIDYVDYLSFANYQYQQVGIDDLYVLSIDYTDDIIFKVLKAGLVSNVFIDKETDESIYNAFMSFKDDISVGDIIDINDAHVVYYDGELSLNVSDIYSIKKENEEQVMGFGKRHTYGIDPRTYYADDLEDLNMAILESYFSNYDGFTIKFDCENKPITFDHIANGTHMFSLVDSYTYSYVGDSFDVLTNQEITFNFVDLSYDTASLYVEKTSKNTYEELLNAALYIKDEYNANNPYKRNQDFEDFPIYSSNYGYLNVRNSQELWIALEYGFLPNFVYDNSAAEYYFNEAKNILRNIITEDMNEIEKVKAIYDYISYNSSYDYDSLSVSNRELYGCQYIDGFFKEKRVVCDGFAKTFSLLCAIEGIEAVYTSGRPNNNGAGHAWNYVNIDGNWYTVCTTYSQLKADNADSLGKFYDYSKVQWISYEPFMAHYSYMSNEFPKEYLWNDIKGTDEYYIYNPLSYDSSYDYVINNQQELNNLFKTIKEHGISGNYYITFNAEDFDVNLDNIGQALNENDIYGYYLLYTESLYDTIYYSVFINEE